MGATGAVGPTGAIGPTGSVGPTGPTGAAAPITPWTATAAGATVAVPSQANPIFYQIDPTGAQVTFDLPVSPQDGQTVVFKLAGASVAAPVLLVAGAGTTVENPANAGVQSATAGTVAIAQQGAIYGIKYRLATTQWWQER